MSSTSETPSQIIEARIQKHLDEIESFEMNDTSFVNSKRIKEINGFVMELKAVLNLFPSSEPILYRGYTIEQESDKWALNYGFKYRYHQDENIRGANSIEEAKSEIDERIAEQESKNPSPYTEQIQDIKNKILALDNAICEMIGKYDSTTSMLIEIRDEFKSKLKDLEIDANTLPFPEK